MVIQSIAAVTYSLLLHLILVFLKLLGQCRYTIVDCRFIGNSGFLGDKIVLGHMYRYFGKLVLFKIIFLMIQNHMAAHDIREKFHKALYRIAGIFLNIVVIVRMAQCDLNIDLIIDCSFCHNDLP